MARAFALIVLLVAAGCSSSSSSTPTTPTSPTPTPSPGGATTTVTLTDALTGTAISGATLTATGLSASASSSAGTMVISGSASDTVHTITVKATGYVDRSVYLKVPGAAVAVTMIPSSLNLSAFDEMLRVTRLQRWTSAPPLRVQTQTMQFTSVNQAEGVAIDDAMTPAEREQLEADLAWALPQLTGNQFTAFASVTRASMAPGDRMQVLNTGVITVGRYAGLQAGSGYWGYSRWQFRTDGTVISGTIMLDRDFDRSTSRFVRSLRSHELGHALGYTHVTLETSVMNSVATTEPNTFDRNVTRIAFQRPPGNVRPDADPSSISLNAIGPAAWSVGAGAGAGPHGHRHTPR
jgi:hypothetical protein